MFRILTLLFFLLAFDACSSPAYAVCQNCPPLYCENPEAAEQAIERKKAHARRQGLPERILALFDRLPKCLGCIETAPDWAYLTWRLDTDAFEEDRGYAASSDVRTMAWSADIEKKLRDDMRRGIVTEYHITHYSGAPCTCCPDTSLNSYKEWQKRKSSIPGYNEELDLHPDVTISHTNPKKLGSDPKDLTSISKKFKRPNTLKAPPLADFMEPPIRVVQVLCPKCQELANSYNERGKEINDERRNIAKMRRDTHYDRTLSNWVWRELEGNDQLAHTKETDKRREDLLEELGRHQRTLDRDKKRLKDALEKRAKLEAELSNIMVQLKECEETACKPKEEPKKQACALPSEHPAITIGANSEVGSGAQLGNEIKSKAKGAAMGAIGGMLGGNGFSLGGGGKAGSSQKGPKTDKDPTSGKFTDISADKTDLEIRAKFTDEGLVVSTNIDGTPGKGTFHAQWLQSADGTVYLPVRFLIIDLYRNWKLSVWWTHDKWVDGEHVYHDEGDSMTVGQDTLGTWKIFEGAEGIGKSIWNALGFKTATKGVQHLGAVYNVPPSAFEGVCPLQLVTHISKPKQDPVTTIPVIGELFKKADSKSKDNLIIMVRPSIAQE